MIITKCVRHTVCMCIVQGVIPIIDEWLIVDVVHVFLMDKQQEGESLKQPRHTVTHVQWLLVRIKQQLALCP